MGFFSNLFSSGFDEPKPMSNEHLLSAIAGQADWLEKMSRSPIESQNSPSIIELAKKRRDYIGRLCLEVLSRDSVDTGPTYPGASKTIGIFSEASDCAKELEASGVQRENAAIRAVKEKLFVQSGVVYLSSWEN